MDKYTSEHYTEDGFKFVVRMEEDKNVVEVWSFAVLMSVTNIGFDGTITAEVPTSQPK